MKTSRQYHVPIALLTLALLVETAIGQSQPPAKHTSPRITVQTLFAAVNGARQNPKYIDEAVACLDLGGLAADQRDPALLALDLEAVLRAACVNTEHLPEDVPGDTYALSGPEGARIALQRQADGQWLFDRETVTQIPKMGAAARKILQEKNREAATLNVAPELASPRATFRTFLTAYFNGDSERIHRCLNLNEVPAAARQEVGDQLARKLCQIILRNRSVIYQDLPDSNYSDNYVWLSQAEGTIELVRLSIGERKGEWVFSRQTVRSIDRLYDLFESRDYHMMLLSVSPDRLRPDLWRAPELWLRERMPAWAKFNLSPTTAIRFEVYQGLGLLLAALAAFAMNRLATLGLAALLGRALAYKGAALPQSVLVKRLRPIGRLAACLFLRWSFLLLDVDKSLLGVALTVLNPVAWLLAAWAVFRLIDLIGDVAELRMVSSKHRAEVTEMLWPVGSLATKIVIALALVLHLMALFAWDVTAVLTGLGIGGVAFALGAQDSLRNLFGSFTLIADRPFVVGETVQIGEGGLGVVERVGLRSTSIRTVDDTLLVVPNSNLTTMNITNFGRRRFRRYTGRIGVTYGTPPEQLTAFREAIRQLAIDGKWTRKDSVEVAVRELTKSAIEIEISAYFDVTTGNEEMAAREALLLGCLRLADELKIDLAFPTQTVHLITDGDADSHPLTLHRAAQEESGASRTATA